MKEKTTFTLTEATKTAILTASKGAYTAQALAVIEGYLASATFKQVAKAIRDCVTNGKGWTASNAAILAGMQSARVQTVNGVKLTDAEYQAQVALGMEEGAKRHAEEAAKSRKDAAEEKKRKEVEAEAVKLAQETAAAALPKSTQLKNKRDELMAWIEDAQKKVVALNGEIEAAEKVEKEAAAAAAADQKKRDDEILASAKAIMAARGVTLATTPLLHAVNEVEMESGIEARREARRANKANKMAIPA